jgi:hypothetical protein
MKAQRGVEIQLYSSFNLGARWGGCSTPRPGCFTPGEEPGYPLYKRLVGPKGQSGRVPRISPLPYRISNSGIRKTNTIIHE